MLRLMVFLIGMTVAGSAMALEEVSLPSIPNAEKLEKALAAPNSGHCKIQQDPGPVTEAELTSCYEKHFFIMEAFALISDDDFSNSELKKERIKNIESEYLVAPQSISKCVQSVLRYSSENNEEVEQEYMRYRMSEILQVIQ